MKKSGVLLILFLALALSVLSQETKTTTLTFTANTIGEVYHPFTSVNVTNVTRGWTETLMYPDTVLVLTNTAASAGEYGLGDQQLEVFPNPFLEQTNVTFQMGEAGWVYAVLYNMEGTVLASRSDWFNQGIHGLAITLEKPQMAILSITTPKGRCMTKLIQTGHGGQNRIEVSHAESRHSVSKGGREIGDFIRGDVMSYMAVFEDGYVVTSDTITQEQYNDDTIALGFPSPIGTLKYLFSVSPSQEVWFSQGNLQYQASTNTWKFAPFQYDYVGLDNQNISPTYNGWIDLFGWGTSGFDHGAICYQPWSWNYNSEEYFAYGQPTYNLYDQNGQADWGCNDISIGSFTSHFWRTLTYEEWEYLLFTRPTLTDIRYAKATVNDIHGVILLPDNWSESYYTLNNTNQSEASFSSNVVTEQQWRTLEQHGAVFLPTAGYRRATVLWNIYGYGGSYWSSSASYCGSDYAWSVGFIDNSLNTDEIAYKCHGRSVRLVSNSPITYQLPTVTTSEVVNVTQTTATCRGEISDDGGSAVTERGICWGISHNPTTNGSHASEGSGTGAFVINMTDLADNTIYYARAYAINRVGTAYGNELSFTTEAINEWLNGTLPGTFSVSDTLQVWFSQGNLQYKASTNTWRFASNQYDYIGEANSNISPDYNDYIDLYGWGTSGWDCGNTYYHPWDSHAVYGGLYGPPGLHNDLIGVYANSDWGVYNPISNGGEQVDLWRTLTINEWHYVLNLRSTPSGMRYAKSIVNNINGLIVLPDDWNATYYELNNTNDQSVNFEVNIITVAQWRILEQYGAVFLPASGERFGNEVGTGGYGGSYWTTTSYSSNEAYCIRFTHTNLQSSYREERYYGLSVRLVRPVQ